MSYQNKLMSYIKNFLYELQEEEQELWESYLDFCEEHKETFQQLPKNIQDLMEDQGEEL